MHWCVRTIDGGGIARLRNRIMAEMNCQLNLIEEDELNVFPRQSNRNVRFVEKSLAEHCREMERLAHVEQLDVTSLVRIAPIDHLRRVAQKWFHDGKASRLRKKNERFFLRLLQVTMSEDGTKQIQGQVICRASSGNEGSGLENDARFLAYVVQVIDRGHCYVFRAMFF